MSDTITTKSIGKGIADVPEDFILSEEPMSRLVFHANIHEKGIRGRIIRQRRESKTDEWIPDEAIDIRTLGKKETINIELDSNAVKELYTAILQLGNVLKQRGVEYGEHKYAVVDPKSVIITDENKVVYIKKILKAGYGKDVWSTLAESNPSLVTKLSHARIMSERQNVLREFEQSLQQKKDESYWQNFFKTNTWIFGYGLRYQFLSLITDRPSYTGADYDGTGEQQGDYLMSSEAKKKFTVLVEIKKPQTEIVLSGKYRAGTWKLGQELLWAVSQVQTSCISWFRDGSRKDSARDSLEGQDIYTYQPKGILVIGHTDQLDARDKLQTFEAYRRGLHNPEIITFDELYKRAQYIVCHNETRDSGEQTPLVEDENDIPF